MGRYSVIVAVGFMALASRAAAQTKPVAFSRPVAAASRSAPQVLPTQVEFLREASPYVGWGGAIGAGAGVAYAGVTVHDRNERGLLMIVDGVIGFAAGMVGGAAVFIVKRAIHGHVVG